jgi:hypothetical protein
MVRRTTVGRWPRREGREVQTSKDTQQKMAEDDPRPDTGEGQDEDQDEGKVSGRGEPKREIGGADGPEPTRYGDWERNGRCTDF